LIDKYKRKDGSDKEPIGVINAGKGNFQGPLVEMIRSKRISIS
jgi:hypothetical protein